MNSDDHQGQALARAIQSAGGCAKLAEALGVTRGAIYLWKRVPAERVIPVERATGVPRQQLRPDLYPAE